MQTSFAMTFIHSSLRACLRVLVAMIGVLQIHPARLVAQTTALYEWPDGFVRGYAIEPAPGGGFFGVGTTLDYMVSEQATRVFRFDANGDTLWTRSYPGEYDFMPRKLAVMSDGGLAFTTTYFYYRLCRTDADGVVLWQWGHVRPIYDITNTSDGGMLAATSVDSTDAGQGFNWLLVKFDANGVEEWRLQHDIAQMSDLPLEVIEVPGVGYFMTGGTWTPSVDTWLARVNFDGSLAWCTTYAFGQNGHGNSLRSTLDGNLIIGVDHLNEFRAVKLDLNGDPIWNVLLLDTLANNYRTPLIPTADGGYALGYTIIPSGTFYSDPHLLRTDDQGNVVWSGSYPIPNWCEHMQDLVEDPNGCLVAVGASDDCFPSLDRWLLIRECASTSIEEPSSSSMNVMYEDGRIIVNGAVDPGSEIMVTDAFGRLILRRSVKAVPATIELDDRAQGVYFVSISDAHGSIRATHKVLVSGTTAR
jgi:outer membrane protein assembly factor BamB